jgi:two-component system sensor histidine kinase/response regulator
MEFEGVHILIAEDSELNQVLTTRQLRVLGYRNVTIARDGEEALAVLARAHVDLIFMDVHMPNLDGFQTTRCIRLRELRGARVPIVAMTANTLAQDREECLAAGMDDHIGKPVALATLRERVGYWLSVGTGAE